MGVNARLAGGGITGLCVLAFAAPTAGASEYPISSGTDGPCLVSTDALLDTTAGTLTTADGQVPVGRLDPASGAWRLDCTTFQLQSGATLKVRGLRPAEILADDDATIDGTVDAAASLQSGVPVPGPGGWSSSSGPLKGGDGLAISDPLGPRGGIAGGTGATAGANGSAYPSGGGGGGGAFGTAALHGGSGGGNGGSGASSGQSNGGLGGAGGGGVLIASLTGMSIGPAGAIDADGGNGLSPPMPIPPAKSGGGGGGGAGGYVRLIAPSIANQGGTVAHGGIGALGSGFATGGNGSDGVIEIDGTVSNPAAFGPAPTIRPYVAPFRPDGLIKLASRANFVGEDVYDADGAGQAVHANLLPGHGTTFDVQLQNDGSDADAFSVTAPAGRHRLNLTYLSGGLDVTSQVTGGGFDTGQLDPGASIPLEVQVKARPAAQPGVSQRILVSSASDAHPNILDAVRAKVSVASG